LRLEFFKKLRTASLNSEFTGSYKKVYNERFRLNFTQNLYQLDTVIEKILVKFNPSQNNWVKISEKS